MLSSAELGTIVTLYAALSNRTKVAVDIMDKAERLIQKQIVARSHLRIDRKETEALQNLLRACRKVRGVNR